MSKPLHGKVALVTGATRGGGRGIAVALGEAGATVYVAGRTSRQAGTRPVDGAPGTIEDTAEEVTRRGGRGVPVRVDFTDERQVAAVFDRIASEASQLDVLANTVWGGNERVDLDAWGKPFWEQRVEAWRETMDAGPRAYVLASHHAAKLMVRQRRGLIVHLTDGVAADGSVPFMGNLLWDVSHQTINRIAFAMAEELRPFGIASVAMMPGFMRTERVLMALKTEEQKRAMRFDLSESPEYVGRAVAALAGDANALARTGRILFAADLAREYGFTDVDGRQPKRFDPAA